MIADYGLILDVLIVVLLGATVVYAAALNRRIVRLRDNRVELELAARAMAEAAAKAEAGIRGLKQTAGSVGVSIQSDIDKARTLRDELTFLVEAGEGLAGRLETAASGVGRAAEAARPKSAKSTATKAQEKPQPQSKRRKDKGNGGNGGDLGDGAGDADGDAARAKRDLMKAIENLR